jgi:hypothetical protein
MTDGTARSLATRVVVPNYPGDDVREKRSGVTVAQITTDERGLVTEVVVLEAPSKSIEEATAAALRQWEFRQLWEPSGRSTTLTARIVFYFVLQDGKGVVRSPAETAYVGRWPDSPRASRPPAKRNKPQ